MKPHPDHRPFVNFTYAACPKTVVGLLASGLRDDSAAWPQGWSGDFISRWFPIASPPATPRPSNLIEEVILHLLSNPQVLPPAIRQRVGGAEWWSHKRPHRLPRKTESGEWWPRQEKQRKDGKDDGGDGDDKNNIDKGPIHERRCRTDSGHGLHYDRDQVKSRRSVKPQRAHPLATTVLYLTGSDGLYAADRRAVLGPTIVTTLSGWDVEEAEMYDLQDPAEQAAALAALPERVRSRVRWEGGPDMAWIAHPVEGAATTFRGDLYHAVLPGIAPNTARKQRLTINVAWWDRDEPCIERRKPFDDEREVMPNTVHCVTPNSEDAAMLAEIFPPMSASDDGGSDKESLDGRWYMLDGEDGCQDHHGAEAVCSSGAAPPAAAGGHTHVGKINGGMPFVPDLWRQYGNAARGDGGEEVDLV